MIFGVNMFHIRVEDSFAAAHFLTRYHGKCENLHGHNYRVRVHAEGKDLDEGGMLFDFGVLKKGLRGVISILDHSLLNDHEEFKNGDPSAERIAAYIFNSLKKELPECPLSKVEVFETEKNVAAYIPDY